MDKAQVPRKSPDGEKLSISQRVDLLCAAFAGMALATAAITKAKEGITR